MANEIKRPNAALINREWYESAKGVLPARDLSCVVVAAIEYVLYGDIDINLQDSAKVVFAMIKPALDSDVAKYLERCARNAANAQRGRNLVAASGTQSQPVGANTTSTSTSTSTSTLSLSSNECEEKEKWIIYGYFWSTGSNAVAQECSAFWSYYESLGWKNNKGAVIVSKLAAARMWRRQFDTKQAPNGACDWFSVLKTCDIYDYNIWNVYAGAERVDDRVIVRLRVGAKWVEDFKAHCGQVLPKLATLWRVQGVDLQPA